ncbi:hypothetical protein PRIC2_010229 [Phytophthora ramorum]
MADLIAKIGRFFADQEAQIQETYSQVAQAPARAPPRPSPPVHKIPTPLNAHPPDVERGSPVANPAPKPPRNTSIARRRLSFKSAVESTAPLQPPECPLESINQILDGVQQQNKVRDVPPLGFSVTQPMARNSLPPEDPWSRQLSGGVVSWTSSSSPASTSSSRGSSVKDEGRSSQASSDISERPRKPRPPQQKNRKRLRKKKRGGSKHPGNQEDDQPDPKQVARENAAKVAAALVLAQERAKRIQQEKLQSDREQELERQEAAVRLQEQMLRIEAVRARSFRHSSYSESEGNDDETDSVWAADTNDMMELHKPPSEFMTELEAQLRDKMSLEMRVKQSCIEKHKQRERVRLKLDKVVPQNAVQSAKVARLAAMKVSLETELAAALEETAQTRQQRRELELADEKERLRRQREAERALQVRLREEEWSSMMEDEKARSQVAAEARAKASQRVEAHSAKLRRMLQAYRYESRSDLSSSAGTNNNEGNQSDNESDASTSRPSTEDLSSEPAQPFKMGFFLPPELADFEEDGLCGTSGSEAKMPNNNEGSDDCTKAASPTQPESTKPLPFRWQVPPFPDQAQFTQVLLDMVSDDEDE